LAYQLGEDPEDVLALAGQGELRSLFQRTDIASLPAGLVAALHESESNMNADNDIKRRQLELRRR
jgi:hypothetical protein